MKTRITLFLLLAVGFVQFGFAQTARVQAIHNCPDPGAAVVDVWIDNTLLLDDFAFQDASPYIDAPAGVNFDLRICASTSTDTTNPVFRKTFNLMMGNAYTVVASGGLAESGATAFDLRAYGGQEQATNMGIGEISVNIIHGAYDAPMVDIYEVQIPAGELVPDLEFGDDIGSYVDLAATDYDIQVRTQTGVVAAEFDVDLSTLGDEAATVLASGYLDPNSAVGTEPFGLIAVLPDGTVLPLAAKATTPARLQVIHNCAATDAATVDVWLNAGPSPLLDDFDFRTSSAFIDAPAGEFFDVSIALPSSTDTTAALFRQSFILESAKTYIVVASGTIGSGTYTPATPFSLEVIADARETSTTSGNTDVIVWHGATDAPTVDVVETLVGAGTIVDDISYGEAQGYLDLPSTAYNLDIRDASGMTTVASYAADLSGLSDLAVTVLASGFLAPADNNNAAAFGLWVSLPTGGPLVELSVITEVPEPTTGLEAIAYPNPASDLLNFAITAEKGGALTYTVRDLAGRALRNGETLLTTGANDFRIDVTDLPAGMYMVELLQDDRAKAFSFMKR
ncbi:MAG: DUF4397 domain-containing protein [Bacteroidota bacterium]